MQLKLGQLRERVRRLAEAGARKPEEKVELPNMSDGTRWIAVKPFRLPHYPNQDTPAPDSEWITQTYGDSELQVVVPKGSTVKCIGRHRLTKTEKRSSYDYKNNRSRPESNVEVTYDYPVVEYNDKKYTIMYGSPASFKNASSTEAKAAGQTKRPTLEDFDELGFEPLPEEMKDSYGRSIHKQTERMFKNGTYKMKDKNTDDVYGFFLDVGLDPDQRGYVRYVRMLGTTESDVQNAVGALRPEHHRNVLGDEHSRRDFTWIFLCRHHDPKSVFVVDVRDQVTWLVHVPVVALHGVVILLHPKQVPEVVLVDHGRRSGLSL